LPAPSDKTLTLLAYARVGKRATPFTKSIARGAGAPLAFAGAMNGVEDEEEERIPVTSSGFDLNPLSALDLLGLASRAAARIACEQSIAVEAAARLLEQAALSETTVWVAGDAADEHTRRFEAAGHRTATLVDLNRLPQRVKQGDLLFVTAVEEAPMPLLMEAKRRGVDVIVFTGTERIDLEGGVALFVACQDARAVELTHSFVVTALCAQSVDLDQAESAA
jgi:hypothetical protein